MAYFAKLNDSNVVTDVIVAEQSFIDTLPGRWVPTDITGVSPKNYAGIGATWRQDLGGFVFTQPFASWVLNTDTCCWEAPTPRPNDGQFYRWNEQSLSWQVT